jgi:pyruvate dehydrogenase E2 component (dihydrolipoamide acetyltransferase)
MLGLDMSEGAVRQWLKREGESVHKGEPLLEIETDKTLIEVEAPQDGILLKILVEAGQSVPVGATVAIVSSESEPVPAAKTISPRARRLAEEHRVNWRFLAGSGPNGLVTEHDVQAQIAQPPAAQLLLPARRVIAERLSRSQRESVHIYLTVSIDMTAAARLRRDGVTWNDLILKAAARCLMEHPAMNSSLSGDGLRTHHEAHIGIAVNADDGTLVVPVLRGVEGKRLEQVAAERRTLVANARARRLAPEEMSGGTFTVSNLGMCGVEQFTAIINPPETGILAVGAITDEPRAVNGAVAIRPVMPVTLGADHRAVDGAEAARFLCAFKELLERGQV